MKNKQSRTSTLPFIYHLYNSFFSFFMYIFFSSSAAYFHFFWGHFESFHFSFKFTFKYSSTYLVLSNDIIHSIAHMQFSVKRTNCNGTLTYQRAHWRGMNCALLFFFFVYKGIEKLAVYLYAYATSICVCFHWNDSRIFK